MDNVKHAVRNNNRTKWLRDSDDIPVWVSDKDDRTVFESQRAAIDYITIHNMRNESVVVEA